MGLHAVVFDYGIVLSGPANAEAHAALVRLTGLTPERFEEIYWRPDRQAYDQGILNGVTYWQKFFREAGLPFDSTVIEKLNYWDARLWGDKNEVMVAWHEKVKQRGLRTAILSNMGDVICAHILKEHAWIQRFDVLLWSFELDLVKPDPAIYRILLERLAIPPAEVLFIDDKIANIEAARALGIQALLYTSVEQLRADLIAAGLDGELSLPGC